MQVRSALPLLAALLGLVSCVDDTVPNDATTIDATPADADIDASGLTPCGPALMCDPQLDVCVIRGPVGPSFEFTCEPVPTGCENDRSCECVAFTYCLDAFDTCTSTAPNVINCECPQCQ